MTENQATTATDQSSRAPKVPAPTEPQHADATRRPVRVVLTGGPGGGKTTAADLFRREIGNAVIVVPEAATLLFAGGFPRSIDASSGRSAQKAIYHVQRNLEDATAAQYPERILLCDRGTVDGGAYWPGGPDSFYAHIQTTRDDELARYDAVLFFESAACGGHGFESENRFRIESQQAAAELDALLRSQWADHPNFTLIPHSTSFLRKMTTGIALLENLVAQLSTRRPTTATRQSGPETRLTEST